MNSEPSPPLRKARGWKAFSRWLTATCVVTALAVSAFALSLVLNHNFHVVSPGRIFRSSQMSSNALNALIRRHGIRTIVDLRGDSVENHSADVSAAHVLGVQHIDFDLDATREVSSNEMERIVAALSTAPKPALIHCKSGADRTGLVSALYLYCFEGKSADAASRQLSVRYGHVPYLFWSDTAAMDRSFWRYVGDHNHGSHVELSASDPSSAAK
jgi:protein tyrosine/serine phosphatase